MKGPREYRDPRCWSSDLEPEFSFLPFLSIPGGTQGSLAAMVMQRLPLATMPCAGMWTGKRRSQLGRAQYWTTGANGADLLPFSWALTLQLGLLGSVSTQPQSAELGWDSLGAPCSAELQNPSLPGRSTLIRPFLPPDSPDPCLPGTNLHCSMNYTSWLMEAQYGWKFPRTPYQRSWWGACVSSAPSSRNTVDLATWKVQAAGGPQYPRGQLVPYHKAGQWVLPTPGDWLG